MTVSVFTSLMMLVLLLNPLQVPSTPSSAVQIKADSVEVDPEGKSASLEGNVKVKWGVLALTAARVNVQYASTGEPTHWKASGAVRVIWRSYTITSHTLKIEQTSKQLTFHGPLEFTRGSAKLKAKRAVLDLGTKRLSIREVQGELNLEEVIQSP